jgi:hypothetical protein
VLLGLVGEQAVPADVEVVDEPVVLAAGSGLHLT